MTLRPRLDAAALRLSASDPAYIGYWLDRHMGHEDLAPVELARKLGLAPERLAVLALCQSPGSDEFAEGIAAACRLAEADAAVLLPLLRQEQTLAAWAAPGPTESETAGWMMAAHDADQPPPGGEE